MDSLQWLERIEIWQFIGIALIVIAALMAVSSIIKNTAWLFRHSDDREHGTGV